MGVEKFTIEVAGIFKVDLKRLMKQHGINNQQEVFQNLLRNVIAANFETAAQMLKCVTTPYVASEKASRGFHNQSQHILRDTACEADKVITPVILPFTKSQFYYLESVLQETKNLIRKTNL